LTTPEPEEQGKTAPIDLPANREGLPPAERSSERSPARHGPSTRQSASRSSASPSAESADGASAEAVQLPVPATPLVSADEALRQQPTPGGLSPATSVADPWRAEAIEASPGAAETRPAVARAASSAQQEVLFVPLAVSIGDGFKFGCGFFLALVLVMLVGFVLLAALFVLTTLAGLNLPLSR
jgi:hypothetical protein